MRRGVLVLGLEGVRQGLDGVEEGLLKAVEAESVVDSQLGLMCEAFEKADLAFGELVAPQSGCAGHDAPDAPTFEAKRGHGQRRPSEKPPGAVEPSQILDLQNERVRVLEAER